MNLLNRLRFSGGTSPAFAVLCLLLSASQPAFTAALSLSNRAPVISGSPPTSLTLGQTYGFTPTASDPDGQVLSFSIANKPAWATFSTATGRLSGTPTSAGTYSAITIAVSDGIAKTSLPAFSITVVSSANRPPVISGTPVTTATVGQPYAFKPAGYDADGDPLTFSIANKPAWATFSATTGMLSGTPSGTGTHANIVISVSDGKTSASLAAFAIIVAAAKTTSVTLSWVPPKTNTDGTPLTTLAGFKLYYGTTSHKYIQILSIPSATITSLVVEGLASGNTWYFALKAVNVSGVESDFSSEVSKTLL
jgi:hypothetical protein